MSCALDGLLDSTQSVTRTLLGVGVDPEALPADGPAPIPNPAEWFPTAVRHVRRRNW